MAFLPTPEKDGQTIASNGGVWELAEGGSGASMSLSYKYYSASEMVEFVTDTYGALDYTFCRISRYGRLRLLNFGAKFASGITLSASKSMAFKVCLPDPDTLNYENSNGNFNGVSDSIDLPPSCIQFKSFSGNPNGFTLVITNITSQSFALDGINLNVNASYIAKEEA